MSIGEFRAIRREAGLKIDPETAEVDWTYAQTLDPYEIHDLRPEEQQIGREYFARAPDSDVWVSFGDLPREVRERLWELHRSELGFPAGVVTPFP